MKLGDMWRSVTGGPNVEKYTQDLEHLDHTFANMRMYNPLAADLLLDFLANPNTARVYSKMSLNVTQEQKGDKPSHAQYFLLQMAQMVKQLHPNQVVGFAAALNNIYDDGSPVTNAVKELANRFPDKMMDVFTAMAAICPKEQKENFLKALDGDQNSILGAVDHRMSAQSKGRFFSTIAKGLSQEELDISLSANKVFRSALRDPNFITYLRVNTDQPEQQLLALADKLHTPPPLTAPKAEI